MLVLVVIAVFAPVIAPFDPYDVTMRDAKGLAPGRSHLLGTTITTGQDVFSMLIYGTRVSLGIGIITGIAISILGSLLGVAAGYLGRAADMIIMRIVDVMLVIPTLPLTILITNIFGKSYVVIVLVFVLFGWPGLARTVRSQVFTDEKCGLRQGGGTFGRKKRLYYAETYPARRIPPCSHEHGAYQCWAL